MRKGDKLIILLLIICAAAWFALNNYGQKTEAAKIVIEVDGDHYKTFDMKELSNKTEKIRIERPEGRYVDIEMDGTGAYVTDVICPDKLCQKTGKIQMVGQSIVCLPNKVVVHIEGEGISEVDQVTY